MFKKLSIFALAIFLVSVPKASATLSLSVDTIPPAVDADIFTITINTEAGAKVTVTGGPNEIPPVTDSDEDGVVEVTVGLIQNTNNNFSIRAEKDGDSSETLKIKINESTAEAGNYAQSSGADITPPNRPILDDYVDEIDAATISITGIAEAESTITAAKPDGTILETTTTEEDGNFIITVALEQNVTNRINISAKDDAGNTSTAIQAVIAEIGEAVEEEEVVEEKEEEEEVEENIAEIAEAFTDIEDHWAKEYIESLRIAGIVGGKSEGIFAPNDFLTRAELTKIALNAFGINLHNVSEKPFDDVSLTAWYAAFVETAKDEGIVKGYNDGFRPNQNVTRAEALKILLTTAEFTIPEATTDFEDVAEGAWYEKYVAFAQNNDIVGGYKDGTFKPNNAITRAEIAKITVKSMELYSTKMAEETAKDTKEELVLVDDENRLYENTNFDFSLQYYKNWFYEGATGSGDTIIMVAFSKDEDAIDNAEATVELKKNSLEDLDKENLDYEKVGNEIRYFLDYSNLRHIEIYGDTDFEGQIKSMAETLIVE